MSQISNKLIALEALLDAEQDLILQGDFDSLTELAKDKVKMLPEIATLDDGGPHVLRIKEKAQRNAQLLTATQDSIGAALSELRDLRTDGVSLQTYAPTGSRQTLHVRAVKKLERKA